MLSEVRHCGDQVGLIISLQDVRHLRILFSCSIFWFNRYTEVVGFEIVETMTMYYPCSGVSMGWRNFFNVLR